MAKIIINTTFAEHVEKYWEEKKMSECCFCDTDNPIVWEDVDGKKVCEVCYERESDTGEVY